MALFGDSHGDFRAIEEVATSGVAPVSVFLGDFDLSRPLDEEVAPLIEAGSDVWYVHGNHDADSPEWYDFVFSSGLADRNLSGRVVDIGGYRFAGLGGVFRNKVWNPRSTEPPGFSTRKQMLKDAAQGKWRDGLPMRHRATIFPEDVQTLSRQRADVLVMHEAPTSHRYGFGRLDKLAAAMGVKLVIHGHHHEAYDGKLANGISVIGMGQADWRIVKVGDLW
ncbi:metallophosphoesterase [Rhizobium laguerreae]|nr:metallophosphoesterase [Rhizobium laguerreae]